MCSMPPYTFAVDKAVQSSSRSPVAVSQAVSWISAGRCTLEVLALSQVTLFSKYVLGQSPAGLRE